MSPGDAMQAHGGEGAGEGKASTPGGPVTARGSSSEPASGPASEPASGSGPPAPEAGQPGASAGAGGPVGKDEWQVPWLPGIKSESWSQERAELAMAFAAAVRKTGSLFVLMTHAAADRIGVNATDLNCMNILSFSGQLTAGELAKATGLTTASITGVVDRLEQAGFVRRERDPRDRRRVVVQMDVERAFGKIMPVFGPMMGAWRRMADTYTDDELRLIVGYYDQMEQILREHLARLRDGAE